MGILPSSRTSNNLLWSSNGKEVISSCTYCPFDNGIAPNIRTILSFIFSAIAVIVLVVACGALDMPRIRFYFVCFRSQTFYFLQFLDLQPLKYRSFRSLFTTVNPATQWNAINLVLHHHGL